VSLGTGKPDDQSEPFSIVGIGASAGGLAVLKTFFEHVPDDSGLAYVVVMHLSPEHKSLLAELLQPHVKMPVEQVTETVKLQRNHVYVIPPGANLNTIDTHLRLTDLESRRQERAPIDHFFRTLAKTYDSNAIGVILSGTGSDGTLGLREIKQKGGPCIVQDPVEAEYDGMPQSAIATGIVDLVLPVRQIPAAILRIVRTQPHVPLVDDSEELDGETRDLLYKIFAQIRVRTGRDFSRYKRSTILRRIQRRMQIRHIEDSTDYLELLRSDAEELRTLGDDLLVNVTSFFRDPETFEMLESETIPALFKGKGAEDEIRVWSVGCATGEEAYSLAMLLLEEASRREISPRIQIFASDLHEGSLRKARDGFYPGDIESHVTPERLKRFFVQESGGYRVCKEIRELVVFAPHNLLGDPPFSRLDLISCRNLLIYIQRQVQRDIIELFHYALRSDGYVVLGTSETIETSELFHIVDKQQAIYQKRNVRAPEPRLPVFPLTRLRLPGEPDRRHQSGERLVYGQVHQRMVEQYAPPSVLISRDDNVVHLSERAGRYLLNAGGEPTFNIFKLVRKELQFELRTALHLVRAQNIAVDTAAVQVRFNGDTATVKLHLRPSLESQQEGFVLVIFDERSAHGPSPSDDPAGVGQPESTSKAIGDASEDRLQALQVELERTRLRLQAIIEEHESSQEETRASNEEMQSTNEELRSTMEELETSKEELQSMNEELQTVNQENRHKVEELTQLSGDLQNLMAATEIATLFLDRNLRIMRFTPKVGELFNVRPIDRGRPLADLTHRLGYGSLMDDAAQALEKLVPIEREVSDEAGHWYLTRVMPYRSVADRIEGVVITFIDITSRKQIEQQLVEAKVFAESIVETLHEPLLVLNPDLTVKSCNPAFLQHFRVRPEHTVGRLIYDLGNGQWNIAVLRDLLEVVLPSNNVFSDFEVRCEFEDLGQRVMLINARRLDHVQLILLGIRDITERKRAAEFVQQTVEGLPVACVAINSAGQVALVNSRTEQLFGHDRSELLGQAVEMLVPERFRKQFGGDRNLCLDRSAHSPLGQSNDLCGLRKDGSEFPIECALSPVNTSEGTYVLAAIADITQRKEAEQALQGADRRKTQFLAMLAHELRNPLAPIRLGLELMRSSTGDESEREEIRQMMQRQTEQLMRLIDDLLDISRITHGKLELRKQTIQLQDVVCSAVEASQPAIDDLGHTLSVSVPEHPVTINADPHRLTQVISNLLNNSARYTPSGGQIWLAAEQQGQNAVITVRDTGIGIPTEMQEQIFEMFSQVNCDQSSSGLGIGLALVKTLVELHGGVIQVESKGADQGTTFTVTLPVVVEAGVQDADVDAGEPVDLAGLRALVVDDTRAGAYLLSMLVQKMGCDTRVANSGQEAIAIAAEYQPDAILMDIGMPGLDGYDTARCMRQTPWGRHATLIAQTGYGQDEDKRLAKEAGFDHHLVKPPELAVLRELLADVKFRLDRTHGDAT